MSKMAEKEATYQAVKIVLLCLVWYVVSSANNVVGKIILSDFPYPMTLTLCQLVAITALMLPILWLWKIPTVSTRMPLRYWFQMILPLAFGKFLASTSSHFSIWKVPVSYAHTVKATLPLFTVTLSYLILREKQTKAVYLSLLPIIGGVLIATLTELSFNKMGLTMALTATTLFAVQNIFSKKCMKETGIHHFRLLFLLSAIATVCFTPIWFIYDGLSIMADTSLLNSVHLPGIIGLLVIDAFCAFGQNIIAFTVIAMVSPVSYAVANATKRISIITVSLITLKNPVTPLNVVGMLCAIFGVLLYNKAKYDQRQAEKAQSILPVSGHTKDVSGMYSKQNGSVLTSLLHQGHPGFQEHIYLSSSHQNGYAGRTLLP